MKKVVVFGGGTGLSYLLSALKKIDLELTVAVTIADNGGSTGKIRKDYNIPAPGDLRRAVVALSEYENLEMLMNYRFDEKIHNHTIGNLVLAALVDLHGNMLEAVREYRNLLSVKQDIIPMSNQSLELKAEMENGEIVIGETDITSHPEKIKKLMYNEEAEINVEILEAVENCDAIILSSGSLYTSIIPNIIFKELQDIIKRKNIKVIYTANIMTQIGETIDYRLSDHIDAINNHFGENKVDVVIANSNFKIPDSIKDSYSEVGSELVKVDIENIDCKLILSDFLIVSEDLHVRHNVEELAKNILKEVS